MIKNAVSLVLLTSFILLALPLHAQDEMDEAWHQQQKDSLVREIKQSEGKDKLNVHYTLMMHLSHYEENIDTIEYHYNNYKEEAERQNSLEEVGLVYTNLLTAYANLEEMDKLIESAPSILDFLEKNTLWRLYYQSHSILLETYFFNHEYQKALQGANELYEKAKLQNNGHGMSAAYYFIALVYTKTNRIAESNEYFRKCIEIQEALGGTKTPLYIQSYYFLFDNMGSLGFDDEEAMQFIREWEKASEVFEGNTGNTNPVARSQIYLAYAKVYFERKDYSLAKLYCDSSVMIYPSRTSVGNAALLLAQVERERGNYKQVLEHVDEAYEIFYSFGESDILIELMKLKLEALLDNQHPEILSLVKTMLQEKDTLSNLQFHSQLDELRTVYEVDKLNDEKEIRRQQLIIAIGGCVLLLLVLLLVVVYSRRLARKNRMLYNQVQELSRKEKDVERCLLARPEETLSKELQLYQKMSKLMQVEKYFTDPELSRKKLADLMGTNEMYLAEAIKAGSGDTYSGYLSNLRLQYALEMLNKDRQATLDAIAVDSGHGSYSQFFRSFSKKYGISPSEYRKLSAQQQ